MNLPRLRPSIAKLLVDEGKSPQHALVASANGQSGRSSWAQERGTAIDALVFEHKPVVLRRRGATYPHGAVTLYKDAFEECVTAAASVRRFIEDSGIIFDTQHAQRELNWTTDGGVEAQCHPDYLNPDDPFFWDLKTSWGLSPTSIKETVETYSYAVSAGAYCEAVSAVFGKTIPFKWLFCESSAPYLCRWVSICPNTLGIGTAKWRAAFTKWKDCMTSGEWPGFKEIIV